MKCALVLSALAVLVAAAAAVFTPMSEMEIQREFIRFQNTYSRSYRNKVEYNERYAIFRENYLRAQELTTKNGGHATFGVTKFSDLTPEEFKAGYLNARVPSLHNALLEEHSRDGIEHAVKVTPDKTNYNWVHAGVTTPIYNQGSCGSCWAFSTTETIESYWALAGHKLTELSMEQIVDCDTVDDGCGGGWPYDAYEYVIQAGGLESAAEYPYTAGNGYAGDCQFQKSKVVATIKGYFNVTGEKALYKQLSSPSGGPISVCVDASTWQYYTGGVLTSCTNNVDHCVQLVGYAKYDQSGAYWIVRNSWGEDWGENGFIWIAIGQDLCLIGDYATVVRV